METIIHYLRTGFSSTSPCGKKNYDEPMPKFDTDLKKVTCKECIRLHAIHRRLKFTKIRWSAKEFVYMQIENKNVNVTPTLPETIALAENFAIIKTEELQKELAQLEKKLLSEIKAITEHLTQDERNEYFDRRIKNLTK